MIPMTHKSCYLSSFVAVFLSLAIASCGRSNTLQNAILGEWVGYLGDSGSVLGLGDVYEELQLFEDGTVTSRTQSTELGTQITNFVGTYKFIADDTIRIDWKEQGVLGNSPVQIFKVQVDDDKLVTTNDVTNQVITYIRPAAVEKIKSNQPERASTYVEVNDLPRAIVGKWKLIQITQKGFPIGGFPPVGGSAEKQFFEDGTEITTISNPNNPQDATTNGTTGGKYVFENGNRTLRLLGEDGGYSLFYDPAIAGDNLTMKDENNSVWEWKRIK